jgi:hypothetical protein
MDHTAPEAPPDDTHDDTHDAETAQMQASLNEAKVCND